MMGRTHLASSAALFTGGSLALTGSPHPVLLPIVLSTALLPDLDHPHSKYGKRLTGMLIPTAIACIAVWLFKPSLFTTYPVYFIIPAIAFSMPFLLYYTVGHRTLTHSLLIILPVAAVICYLWPYAATYAAITGYCLHVLEDAVTVGGVPIFWPFKKERYAFPFAIKTNGILEYIILISSFALVFFIYGKVLNLM